MKTRGFTLLELVVVIIILGVLATLGIGQYGRMVERSRGAEAKAVLGQIRSTAVAFRLQNGTIAGFTHRNAGIGADTDQIPGADGAVTVVPAGDGDCRSVNYFSYGFAAPADPTIVITARRCGGASGKAPSAPAGIAGETLTLTTNINTGVDTWGGTGGY